MKTPDIKTRMLVVALMPALLISLAFSLFVITQRHTIAETALHNRGTMLARQLAPAAEYGTFSGNIGELQRLVNTVTHEPDVTAVTLYDAHGDMLARAGSPRATVSPGSLFTADENQAHSEENGTLFFHRKILKNSASPDDLLHTEPSAPASEVLGSLTVEMSRNSVTRDMQETLMATAIFSLLAAGIGSLLARRLIRDVTEPIITLQQTVALIQEGRLDIRVPLHPVGILRDLEEGFNTMTAAMEAGRDQLEQRIREATAELHNKKDEAERTSLAKTRFLAAASHDLRQPLHALTLFTDELDLCQDSAKQHKLLRQTRAAVDAMNQQLSALLDISRLDLGDISIHCQVIPLDPMIERLTAVHTPDAHTKGLHLRYVSTRTHTLTDPRLLESMLGNLIANAVRYTDQGGIVIGVRRRGGKLRLEVWDTGIGIQSTQLQLIFQEFYQVTNPERDAEKGLGIGLSIVARLAQRLVHPVDVRSIPGRGSVFSIMLPAASPEPSVELTSPRDDYQLNRTVVILGSPPEENEGACICGLVESWGCRVCCIERLDALECPGESPPDAIIFRAEAWADVRQYGERQPATPILIMIGTPVAPLADPDTPASGYMPAYAQLSLPIRPARLRALLQSLLQSETKEDTPTV